LWQPWDGRGRPRRRANFVLHTAGWLEGDLSVGYEKLSLDCE
jgi:trimethylamine:corrinoid methyltransferase-like protein